MKKIFIVSVSIIMALCACTKQELAPSDTAKSGEKQIITATVNIPTKLAYSENTPGGGGGMSSLWEAGDTFLAIQDGTTVVEFTLVSGAGEASATFQAVAENVTAGTEWKAVLGKGSVHGTEIHCGYLEQSGKITALKNFNYVTADGTGLTPSFDFANGTKLSYILRVKVPEKTKYVEYTPCGYDKVTSSDVQVINLNSGEQEDYTSSSRVSTISLGAAADAGDIVYIAVPCMDFSNTHNTANGGKQHQNIVCGIILTFLNDTEADATASTGVVINNDLTTKGGKVTTVNCAGMTLMSRPRPADAIEFQTSDVVKSFSTSKQGATSVYTYWAPYNIGATTASDSGKFFMFGETVQKSLDGTPEYSYYTGASKGYMSLGHQNAKLIDDSNNTTFYTVQGTKYDAARVLWGTSWQMPHIIDLAAIYDNVENVKSLNGSCIRFTNTRTSNVIDIPVTGKYKEGAKSDAEYMNLWSADKNQRSADNSGWNQAYGLYIKNDLTDNAIDRYDFICALPIRPVLATSYVSADPFPYVGPANSGVAPGWEEQVF